MNSLFDASKYTKRVSLEGDLALDIDGLTKLHKAQLLAIPFENFCIMNGKSIKVDTESVFDKLVNKKRGGYCFELNSLLLNALTHYGFDARPLLGRVHVTGKPTGRGHQITLVTIEEKRWIVDSGFGSNTPRSPIPLIYDAPFSTDTQCFRLVKNVNFGTMLQLLQDKVWVSLYSFDFEYVCGGDIEYGNHFTSTNPSSIFTQDYVAAQHTKNGVITLYKDAIKVMEGNIENTATASNLEELRILIKQYFNIDL